MRLNRNAYNYKNKWRTQIHSIIRTKKHNSVGGLKSRQTHTYRTRDTPNADPKKAGLNRLLFGHTEYAQIARDRILAWDEGRIAPGVPPEAFGEWLATSPPQQMDVELDLF